MIYLVKLDSAYKIGFTSDLKKRIRSYRTSCVNVELVAFRDGSMNNEKELHKALADYNIRNELYEVDDEIKSLFETFIFDSQINYKNELDKLKKENNKLKEELLTYKKVKYSPVEETQPKNKYTKEVILNGKVVSFDIVQYETCVTFGDSLLYKFEDKSFYSTYGQPAKVYTVSGSQMHYVKTGLALTITELYNIVSKL